MHLAYWLAPFFVLVLLFLNSSHSAWAPFQSRQVKEICLHMTPQEKKRAARHGAAFGFLLGAIFGIFGLVGFAIGARLFDSILTGIIVVQPAAWAAIGVVAWKWLPRINRAQKEFLASTKWSTEQGLTPDQIVLRGP